MASFLRSLLVDHPTISNFEWVSGETPGASLPSLATTVLTYVTLALLLRRRLPSPPRPLLHLLSATHSLILLLLSFFMATATTLSIFLISPTPTHPFCFPPTTPARGPLFFWAYVFYLSKIYELLDTLLILLSGGRRLTFLHVYHHAVVLVMCYLWLEKRQSLMPVGLVTNAAVHVVMYGYYFSASVGWRWPETWKRKVTELQIWQFGFGFAASVVFLWIHYGGEGCEGMGAWQFNAAFNASLMVLFLDFHSAAYAGGGRKKREA